MNIPGHIRSGKLFFPVNWWARMILPALLMAWLHVPVSAQVSEKDSLQQKKAILENEIEFTNKLLEETQKSKKASLSELAVINTKITKREELIKTISAEISSLDRQLSLNQKELETLRNELKELKDDYAEMIYFAFKNKGAYDRLMFIFSARDFNQAYQRLKYMQQYNEYRKQQALQIQQKQEELAGMNRQIEEQRAEKESLLTSKEREVLKLDGEKSDKSKTIVTLGDKEGELRKVLREKEQAAKKLQQAIQEIIAEEIRRSREGAAVRSDPSATAFALTPEERELSNTFAANIGKLPWPTERGIVSGTFGEHPHPDLQGIKVKNNGIDILTSEGSQARCIFDGEVTRVIVVPKYNNVVIIRHGEFLSVYSNLDDVVVTKGDNVKTKQVLGLIHTDETKSRTELHFELWKGKELLDPLQWIVK